MPGSAGVEVLHGRQEAVGAENVVRSCHLHVLVHGTAELVASEGLNGRARSVGECSRRGLLIKVRAVRVVVLGDLLQDLGGARRPHAATRTARRSWMRPLGPSP